MIFVSATSRDCPGDNCPTLAEDSATQDVVVQLYTLSPEKAAEADEAMGALPAGELRGVMPAAVFEQLVAERTSRLG